MFTSSLSVSEFVLLAREKVVPLGQVMGNSVYKMDLDIAMQRMGTGEIKALTTPLRDVYTQVLVRMADGARRLGADAVVGVRLEETRKIPALLRPRNVLTVSAIGTAVRLGTQERPAKPPMFSVSGQDYYALRRAGLMPVGLVFGQSVYFRFSQARILFADVPRDAGLLDFERINVNIERTDYTEAVTKAQRLAVRRMEAEAVQRHAEGIVGVIVTMRPCLLENGLVVECMAHGTAVAAQGQSSDAIAGFVSLG